jgi:hypothetical protein
MEVSIFSFIRCRTVEWICPEKPDVSEKHKEFSVMNTQNANIDFDTIEFFMRKARVERSIAITSAFGNLAGMVKNIFSTPEAGNVARCR